jgi:hypothetical protein
VSCSPDLFLATFMQHVGVFLEMIFSMMWKNMIFKLAFVFAVLCALAASQGSAHRNSIPAEILFPRELALEGLVIPESRLQKRACLVGYFACQQTTILFRLHSKC